MDKVRMELRKKVVRLIDETARLEEKYADVLSFLNSSGIEVGDGQFDTLNAIKDGYDDVEALLDSLLESA